MKLLHGKYSFTDRASLKRPGSTAVRWDIGLAAKTCAPAGQAELGIYVHGCHGQLAARARRCYAPILRWQSWDCNRQALDYRQCQILVPALGSIEPAISDLHGLEPPRRRHGQQAARGTRATLRRFGASPYGWRIRCTLENQVTEDPTTKLGLPRRTVEVCYRFV